jgi:hypothetical protein
VWTALKMGHKLLKNIGHYDYLFIAKLDALRKYL